MAHPVGVLVDADLVAAVHHRSSLLSSTILGTVAHPVGVLVDVDLVAAVHHRSSLLSSTILGTVAHPVGVLVDADLLVAVHGDELLVAGAEGADGQLAGCHVVHQQGLVAVPRVEDAPATATGASHPPPCIV